MRLNYFKDIEETVIVMFYTVTLSIPIPRSPPLWSSAGISPKFF